MRKSIRAIAALSLAFGSLFWTTQAEATSAPCDTFRVNGGDQAFLMDLNTPLEFGGTVYDGNIYVSPKGTITFGQGDFTFWDYPSTPSISIASYDYHAFDSSHPWGAGNDLYVSYGSTDTSICVDWKVLPWGQSSGSPVYIRMIAYVNPENYTWTPTFQVSDNAPTGARYGLRYTQGGEIVPLEIQTITEPPEEAPVVQPDLYLNAPTNLRVQQLSDGNVELIWDAPEPSSLDVERYAVSWQNENGSWGVASADTSIYLDPDLFASTGGLDSIYTFTVRSDNDTEAIYSAVSDSVDLFIATPYIPTPVPQSDIQIWEGDSLVVLAPENKKFSGVVAWYGDPNDYSCGADVSDIIDELSNGKTEIVLESNNGVFGDPCGGIVKSLFVTFTYDDLPAPVPVVTEQPQPTPEPVVTQSPKPQPIVIPEPLPVVTPVPTATPEPAPSKVPEPVVSAEPSSTPSPVPSQSETSKPVVTQEPTPTPTPVITTTPKPMPSPSVTPTPVPTEQTKTPIIISAEPDKVVSELLNVDLDTQSIEPSQIAEIRSAVEEVFADVEQGSAEYEQALEALTVLAQADDPELPEELAAIPLIGNIAGEVLNVFNDLGNVGADMSPEQRAKSEETVVAAVIVGQVAQLATAAAASAGVSAAASTRRIK